MILVDGEKYACVQCIRGHRSSTCKHSQRPLVQVRSRGRPSLSQSHRIAVTESEIVLNRDQVNIQNSSLDQKKGSSNADAKDVGSSCCCQEKKPPIKKSCCSGSSDGGCGSSRGGVILLKASKREFVDVVNGNLDFVGPYKGSSTTSFNVGSTKRPKHIKSSTCQSRSTENRLKALKTLKVNEVKLGNNNTPVAQNNGNYNLLQPINTNTLKSQEQYSQPIAFDLQKAFNELHSSSLHDHIPPTYGLNYPMHGYNDTQYIHPEGTSFSLKHTVFPQSNNNTPRTQSPHQSKHEPQLFDMFQGEGCADECNCGPTCSCPGCLIHRTNEELREYGILDSSTTVSTPSEWREEGAFKSVSNGVSSRAKESNQNSNDLPNCFSQKEESPVSRTPNGQSDSQLLNFETIDELLIQEMLEDDCYCEADSCQCFNCLKHGISNGVRLKDDVKVFDPDLFQINGTNGYPVNGTAISSLDGSGEHDCGCKPEDCDCHNCPTHGIVNGVRLGKNKDSVDEESKL